MYTMNSITTQGRQGMEEVKYSCENTLAIYMNYLWIILSMNLNMSSYIYNHKNENVLEHLRYRISIVQLQ